jgi:site-specific recombinase XerD
MTLSAVVSQYVAHHRALGQRFRAEEALLRSFCRMMGDPPIASIPAPSVLAFLDGHGPITDYWTKKHRVLSGLYRFALARGLVGASPLPCRIRRPSTPAFVPYISPPAELKRLLDAVPTACGSRASLDDYVLRALLPLLYGAGLRFGEALALRLGEVDLPQAILQVRETKFHKTRLVPMGRDLTQVLTAYVATRNDAHPATADARCSPVECGQAVD